MTALMMSAISSRTRAASTPARTAARRTARPSPETPTNSRTSAIRRLRPDQRHQAAAVGGVVVVGQRAGIGKPRAVGEEVNDRRRDIPEKDEVPEVLERLQQNEQRQPRSRA